MKILLLGDYGNYHSSLAIGLRKLGHEVTTISDNPDAKSDITLTHGSGRMAETLFLTRLATGLAGKLKGYDIVQLATPEFLNLSYPALRSILSRLKKNNGAVLLTAMSHDAAIVGNLCSKSPALRYSPWHGPKGLRSRAKNPESGLSAWLDAARRSYTEEVYTAVDGIVAGRYEYYRCIAALYPEKPLAYGGIPVEEGAFGKADVRDFKDRFSVLLTSTKNRDDETGLSTLNTLLQMAEVHSKTNFRRVLVAPMGFDDFLGEMKRCEMVGEDIYSYSPGRLALAAMSLGIVPICGAEEEYFRFIGEEKLRPAFNPDPDHVKPNFKELAILLSEPGRLEKMSAEGPEFVRKHNDAAVVAGRFIDFWKKLKA